MFRTGKSWWLTITKYDIKFHWEYNPTKMQITECRLWTAERIVALNKYFRKCCSILYLYFFYESFVNIFVNSLSKWKINVAGNLIQTLHSTSISNIFWIIYVLLLLNQYHVYDRLAYSKFHFGVAWSYHYQIWLIDLLL